MLATPLRYCCGGRVGDRCAAVVAAALQALQSPNSAVRTICAFAPLQAPPQPHPFWCLPPRVLLVLPARRRRGGGGGCWVRLGLGFRPLAGAACDRGPRMMSAAGAEGAAGENASKAVNVVIKGKVQGVYYRNWTVDAAQQLGVNGWVRNLKDGSVEAVFSGKAAAVDSLIDKCHSGPSAARVSAVEVSAWKDDVPQGFERKPTL